jgi:hypothetical protein
MGNKLATSAQLLLDEAYPVVERASVHFASHHFF